MKSIKMIRFADGFGDKDKYWVRLDLIEKAKPNEDSKIGVYSIKLDGNFPFTFDYEIFNDFLKEFHSSEREAKACFLDMMRMISRPVSEHGLFVEYIS